MDFGQVEKILTLDVQKVRPVPSSNVPRRAPGERLQLIMEYSRPKRRQPAKAALPPAKKPGTPKVPVRASEFNGELPWPEDEDEKVKLD